MKRIANPITTTELCSYGCGKVARYKNGSNKFMCQKSNNSCPANRKKNSKGVKNSGRDYVETYKNLPQETKDKIRASSKARCTNEWRQNISNKLKGRVITPEWREKLRIAALNRKNKDN